MSKAPRYPSYLDCVAQILSTSPEPLSLEALIAQVERRRPFTKGAQNAIYKAIDQLYQAVPISPANVGWLTWLLQDNTIRHTLENEETRRGYLLLDELEHATLFPQFFQEHRPDERTLTLDLMGGSTISGTAAIQRQTWALTMGAPFAEWLDEQGAVAQDDLLIRVIDAQAGHYLLRLQPREVRDEEAIDRRNQELARAAEEIAREVGQSRRTIYTWELVARLIGRGIFNQPVPPDDLHFVLHEYSWLRLVEGAGYQVDLSDAAGLTVSRAHPARRGRTRTEVVRARTPYPQAADDLFRYDEEEEGEGMADLFPGAEEDPDEICDAYQEYLDAFEDARRKGKPLSHDDFHLLEAELEVLVDLELEFGYLLPEQTKRKEELADRLFIDPESLVDGGWEEGDDYDEGPPFWQN